MSGMRWQSTVRILVALFAVLIFWGSTARPTDEGLRGERLKVRPNDAATISGFEHFYNMDYSTAIRDFDSALQAHPSDSFAVNHLLLAIIFQELHHGRVLDPDLYASNKFLGTKKISVDSAVRERIQVLTERALELSAQRIDSNPRDMDALYARGVTRGLQAAYLGVVEKAWFSALRKGLAAYKDHKQVLSVSPGYSDAKLVVGMYNYVVGSLPWHIKAAAFLVAITGSKADGIEYLSQAAQAGGETSVDAKTFLGVFLSRERRYAESISLIHELHLAYPHNFLFALGEANLLRKSGRLREAADAYRDLLGSGHDRFREPPLELAAYGLAQTLRSQGDYRNAAVFYDSVPGYSNVDQQLASEARKSAAEMKRLLRAPRKSQNRTSEK